MLFQAAEAEDYVRNLADLPVTNQNTTLYILAEQQHAFDAYTALLLNVTIIGCLIGAYYAKRNRIYHVPESAVALLLGVVIGGIARLSTNNLILYQFSPEVFFFVLLPPIIFDAGYALERKDFFENIGAITLYAMVGTFISTFVIGGLTFYAAKVGLIRDIDQQNPMEALLFGSLISAVDPVATLSIMGNPELQCDPLLYSLVFGESVLNDAISIALFKTFFKYYNPLGPTWSDAELPSAIGAFTGISLLSVVVGVGLGLAASYLYRHTLLSEYPKLETSILFCFCYLCYATAEAVGLSGIMALFFHGIVLSHYNKYNLSSAAEVATEQIFATLATISETIVFLYMGMGVFTGRFQNWDVWFSVLALTCCLLARALNIFPLSALANLCRGGRTKSPKIEPQMQAVLWFAGLRGAIAYALSENMPGPNKETYVTATLSICIFTTVVCGSCTDRMLTVFGMKQPQLPIVDGEEEPMARLAYYPDAPPEDVRFSAHASRKVYEGVKGLWASFDDKYLMSTFGGGPRVEFPDDLRQQRRNYELRRMVETDAEGNVAMVSDDGEEIAF